MPEIEIKYGVAHTIRFPMVVGGGTALAQSGDWTPLAGDVKLSKDGGALNNPATTTPSFSNGMWEQDLTAVESQFAEGELIVRDQAGAEVEDQVIILRTYGDASAYRQFEASDFAADLDVYTAKIFPLISAVDGENVWGVIFFKNGIQMTGAVAAAENPKVTVYDEDGTVTINAQNMTQVSAQDGFKFVTTTAEMTPGIAYYAEVTHDSLTTGWSEPLSIWN